MSAHLILVVVGIVCGIVGFVTNDNRWTAGGVVALGAALLI